MDDARIPSGLIEAFTAARKREANGALIAVAARTAGRADASLAAVSRAVRGRPGASVQPFGPSSIAVILAACSAPDARSAAEAVRAALAPAAVAAGIVNFYEFFTAEGTSMEIAREIARTAAHRLAEAANRADLVCDASDLAASAEQDRPVVVVVEPDPVSVELLTAALEAAGFEVRSFQNGEAAMASLEASPPSLVVCEAMSPRMNGFVIRERLNASPRLAAIPFILVSHRKTEEMIRRAAEADIRHFFRKPLSVAEVVGLAVNLTRSRAP